MCRMAYADQEGLSRKEGNSGKVRDSGWRAVSVSQLPSVENRRNYPSESSPVLAQFCQDLPGLEQASKAAVANW